MEEGLDGTAVYVCVKMYSRDLNLSQPPLKVAIMAQITSVHPAIPCGVHAAVELCASQIDTFTKIGRPGREVWHGRSCQGFACSCSCEAL